MWELEHKEGWVLKNWCFWTVVPEKTIDSPFVTRRSNQSILKEMSPGYSLEGLMLNLKLQYFGHLMQRVDSLERPWCCERLKAEEEGDRRWNGWMASQTQWTRVWANPGRWWRTGRPGMLQSSGLLSNICVYSLSYTIIFCSLFIIYIMVCIS